MIPQLRTTDLAASIGFYAAAATALTKQGVRLLKEVHETAWGTREFAIKDDQGHTRYFGERREEG